uniref:Cullin family profile domain-containing protein n=1 Tax=viral metagenome TaxID=1070528 RepID=A0A6C0LVF8_9ZZZZ
MELLKNQHIQEKLNKRTHFDLINNNSRLGIIVNLETNPIAKLKEIMKLIIMDEDKKMNHYIVQSLFIEAQMINPNIIIELIIETILAKVNIICEAIERSNIDLASWNQIWADFRTFTNKLEFLMKNYLNLFTERNVIIGKFKCDILSTIQLCIFYQKIIEKYSLNGIDIFSKISSDIRGINIHNIDQLIDFIESMIIFLPIKKFIKINYDNIQNIIHNILSDRYVINLICARIHKLLIGLSSNKFTIDDDSSVLNVDKKSLKNIYGSISILSGYGNRENIVIYHRKFMQVRIMNFNYDNFEVEIEIIRKLSSKIGSESQQMINMINDIYESRNISNIVQKSNANIITEKYKVINDVRPQILNPIIINKQYWCINNLVNMDITYPLELEFYHNLFAKCYEQLYKNKYIINWQPTLGFAKFDVCLGSRDIEITCNILQAIALCYLNDHSSINPINFSLEIGISEILAEKILESLFEANLLLKHNDLFIVNINNYTGNTIIDIRKLFVDTFAETSEQKID